MWLLNALAFFSSPHKKTLQRFPSQGTPGTPQSRADSVMDAGWGSWQNSRDGTPFRGGVLKPFRNEKIHGKNGIFTYIDMVDFYGKCRINMTYKQHIWILWDYTTLMVEELRRENHRKDVENIQTKWKIYHISTGKQHFFKQHFWTNNSISFWNLHIALPKSNIDTKKSMGFQKCISGFRLWQHFGYPC